MKSLNDLGMLTRQGLRVVLMAALVALGGCGGGGGGSGEVGTGKVLAKSPGSVSVTVTDVLGDPVAGAEVYFSPYPRESPHMVTNADGRAVFAEVFAGSLGVVVSSYGMPGRGPAFGYREFDLAKKQHVDVDVVVRPSAIAEPFAIASIDPASIAVDRRSFGVLVRVVSAQRRATKFNLRECEPSTTNDAVLFQADCVEGPAGSDAAYAGSPTPESTPPPDAGPLTLAILLDQSGHTIVNDPSDMRLFAIKYFLTTLGAEDRVVLAAFASNDASSGQRSLLPQAPLTLFPVANPQLVPLDRGMLQTIDSFAALEGGAAPLYAALGQLLDFVAARSSPGGRRAVVVFTDGLDDTCGSAMECQSALQAVIDKSRSTRATVYTVGISNQPDSASRGAMRLLVAGNGGVAQWATRPDDFDAIFGQLGDALEGRGFVSADRFRVESSIERAFEQGRTLLGTVWTEEGGLTETYEVDVPFAVRIP